jgi:hypothetical protein
MDLEALKLRRQALQDRLKGAASSDQQEVESEAKTTPAKDLAQDAIDATRALVFRVLLAPTLILPMDAATVVSKMTRLKRKAEGGDPGAGPSSPPPQQAAVESVLHDLSASGCVELDTGITGLVLRSVDTSQLALLDPTPVEELSTLDPVHLEPSAVPALSSSPAFDVKSAVPVKSEPESELDALLNSKSVKEQQITEVGKEIEALINEPTAREKSLASQFQTKGKSAIREFCVHGTKAQCCDVNKAEACCDKVHFHKIVQRHTDLSLGDCSYLNACRHLHTCKFMHYEIDDANIGVKGTGGNEGGVGELASYSGYAAKYGAQWINCDVREIMRPEAHTQSYTHTHTHTHTQTLYLSLSHTQTHTHTHTQTHTTHTRA